MSEPGELKPEDLAAARSAMQEAQLQPTMLIVPPELDYEANFLLYAKVVKRQGRYALMEYRGETRWCVHEPIFETRMYWPRWLVDDCTGYGPMYYYANRHWRRRGWQPVMREDHFWKAVEKAGGNKPKEA